MTDFNGSAESEGLTCSCEPQEFGGCEARRRSTPELCSAEPAAEQGEGFLTPWGPFEMGGFEGCTDQDPTHCACATDQQPTCEVCGAEIEPGEQAWARQWPCYNTLPLDDPDQDWDVISWHDACPDVTSPPESRTGGES